ncbi:dTMP kinase [candidate division TM6 bacterium RIFCSPHIGHO2_12_FULL_36_22]|nr:MAG: dTMP kinase [candidate division TM6 bacterium RIFCSPHIGHO2_12_FULL_36_22]
MITVKNGLLISVEGIDGCGKSTFIKNLQRKLQEHNVDHIITKEPGGSPLGKLLRQIILTKEVPLCSKSEYLLFAADRAQHIEQIIKPALIDNKVIVSDRMGDSSIVYQGYARGLDIDMIKTINAWATNGTVPDIIFYLNIDVPTAFKRIYERKEELTSFEREHEDFMYKVKKGFDELFNNKDNVVKLDAHQTPDTLAQQAIEVILQKAKK